MSLPFVLFLAAVLQVLRLHVSVSPWEKEFGKATDFGINKTKELKKMIAKKKLKASFGTNSVFEMGISDTALLTSGTDEKQCFAISTCPFEKQWRMASPDDGSPVPNLNCAKRSKTPKPPPESASNTYQILML